MVFFERSQSPRVRILFLLGMSDELLGARPLEEGLFSYTEDDSLRLAGVELGDNADMRYAKKRMDLYEAIATASDKLYVSYPANDLSGRPQREAFIVSGHVGIRA